MLCVYVCLGGGDLIIMAASIALPAHNNNVNNNSNANSREKCTDSELSISLQMEANNGASTTTDAIGEATDSSPQPIITISGSFTDSNSVSSFLCLCVYTRQTNYYFFCNRSLFRRVRPLQTTLPVTECLFFPVRAVCDYSLCCLLSFNPPTYLLKQMCLGFWHHNFSSLQIPSNVNCWNALPRTHQLLARQCKVVHNFHFSSDIRGCAFVH